MNRYRVNKRWVSSGSLSLINAPAMLPAMLPAHHQLPKRLRSRLQQSRLDSSHSARTLSGNKKINRAPEYAFRCNCTSRTK